MKRLFLIPCLLVTALFARAQSSAPVDVRYYVQPSVVYAFLGDFKDVMGGAVAFGATFNARHMVEVEVARFTSETTSFPVLNVDFTPILASYKYRLPLSGGLSAHVGGAVGVTLENPDTNYYYGRIGSASAFTVGGQAGLSKTLTDKASLDLTAKTLWLNGTSVTTAGSIEIISLGVNFRF